MWRSGALGVLTIWLVVGCTGPTATGESGITPSNTAAPASSAAPAVTQGSPVGSLARPSVAPSAAVASSNPDLARLQPLSPRATIKVALKPDNMNFLPVLLGIDQGAFASAGLDIDLNTYPGSAQTQMPLLARGDIDMSAVVPGPSTFNQVVQGFDVKLITSLGDQKSGRVSGGWLSVRSDEVDSIKVGSDMKGHVVDGGSEGGPLAMMAREAIREAGLTPGVDVTLTHRGTTAQNEVALAQNKGADVIAMIEPTATLADKQGYAVRWKDMSDVLPWYQTSAMGVSKTFLASHRMAVIKFLEVYVLICREINASDGAWTPEIINSAAKWAQVDPQVITDQGGVPYYDPNGVVSIESLQKTQDIWLEDGQVSQSVDVAGLVDQGVLDEALTVVGRTS